MTDLKASQPKPDSNGALPPSGYHVVLHRVVGSRPHCVESTGKIIVSK